MAFLARWSPVPRPSTSGTGLVQLIAGICSDLEAAEEGLSETPVGVH